MSGSHIVAVVLICFQVQQAFSLKCYQNFNISDENATPSGKGTETDCSAYPYTLFNNDITQCVKAIGEGYTSRMCDFGKFCSLFGVSNNDCKTMPFVLICFQVQQAFSLKCYQNFNITDDTSTPNGKGTETDCSAYPYNLLNSDITKCIKMTGEGYTTRTCDFGNFCSQLDISNNKCKSVSCDTSVTIPGNGKSQTLRSLTQPSNLASDDCNVCCCNKNGCNFAIGPKAFTTLILAGLAFVFLLKK
uniref:Uncharacterized protein n=1 Tax=Acrobeloides nanus TaxID=290746 RepID=A0A914EBU4_9BILA